MVPLQAFELAKVGLHPAEGSIDELLQGCNADPKLFGDFSRWVEARSGLHIKKTEPFWEFTHPSIKPPLIIYLAMGGRPIPPGGNGSGFIEKSRGYFDSLLGKSRGGFDFYNYLWLPGDNGNSSARCFVKIYNGSSDLSTEVKVGLNVDVPLYR